MPRDTYIFSRGEGAKSRAQYRESGKPWLVDHIISQWGSKNAEKNYAHQRKTTGTSSDSLQFRPFSKR